MCMEILYFIVAAVLTAFIYRQGLKDGQKISSGERLPDIKPRARSKQAETRVDKGLKNILAYGIGGDKK